MDIVQFEGAIEEGEVKGTMSNVEEAQSKLAPLKYPPDPVNKQAFDLKCNASYVKLCVDRGPCQLVLRCPKNSDG